MPRHPRLWVGLVAILGALLPNTAAAGGVSFASPAGLPSLPALYAVTCPTATTCVAVGGVTAATVVSTRDLGQHWTTSPVAGVTQLNGVACIDGRHCVAVGAAGTAAAIAVTSDGVTWAAVAAVPEAVPLTSVSCVALSRCMAVGSTVSSTAGGFVSSALVSVDGGVTWTTASTPFLRGTPASLNAVDCTGSRQCFAVGGSAWVTRDFGGSWQDISPPNGCGPGLGCVPTYSDLTGVDFTDASHGVTVGGEQCGGQGATRCPPAWFSTSDGGASWTMWPARNRSAFAFLEAVHCSGRSCLASSDSFTSSSILLTSDQATWSSVGSWPGALSSIACAPTGPCVAAGANGTTGVLLVSKVGIGPRGGGTVVGSGGSGEGGSPAPVVSSFSTSLPTPAAVGSSAAALLLSALLALGLVLLAVFPSQLFNRTYDENHVRIREWWERRLPWARSRRERAEARALHGAAALATAILVGALLGTLLDPAAGFNARSAALFAGIVLALLSWIGLGAAVTAGYRRARRRGTRWEMCALPSGLLVAAVCVLISRAVNFQPGYLYGIIGGIAFAGALPRREEGHLVALTSAVTLVVAAIAWLLWVPVEAAAARGGAGFGTALLANVLSALFVGGLAGVVLGLVPLRFLPGEKLAAWHWGAWTTVFAVAVFGLVQIMLRPQSAAAHVASVPLWTTVGLFLAFGAASVAFWGYFRATTPQHDVQPAPGE